MIRRLVFISLIIIFSYSALFAASTRDELKKIISKKPLITKIEINGNENFSDDEIKSKLFSSENGFWQSLRLKRRNRYSKQNQKYDLPILQYFYRSSGFIDADFKIDLQGSADFKTVVLGINIDEGLRYRISEVNMLGRYGKFRHEVGLIVHNLVPGNYINWYLIDQVKHDIKTVYANSGYPYAKIDLTAEKDSTSGTISFNISVDRGLLVLFGNVLIDSALTTSPRIFSKEIVFGKGDLYSREKYILSKQRLIGTGLFSFVDLKPDKLNSRVDSLIPDFVATARERPQRYINFATGASQDPEKDLVWSLSGSFGNRNILGSARKVLFRASSAFQVISGWQRVRSKFEFSYTEPYFLGVRMPLVSTFAFEPGVKSTVQDYRIRSVLLQSTLIREFSLITRLSVTGAYEQVKISGVDASREVEIRDEEGISVDRKLILYLVRDSRPILDRFNPFSGSHTQYRLEYVGGILGGDNNFLKLEVEWAKYNLLTSQTIIASRVKFGWVNEFGTSDFVPSRDRFYLGGAYTIRGFVTNDIGPRDNLDEPTGGEVIALLNLEIRRPLIWKFWWSLFFDSGFNVEKMKAIAVNKTIYSFGGGLQFQSPVGPIRIDYGRRIAVNDVEPGGRLHLSLLYAF